MSKLFAEASNTHSERLAWLTDDTDRAVKCAAARNPNTPMYALRRLVNTAPFAVQQAVLRNFMARRHFDGLMR